MLALIAFLSSVGIPVAIAIGSWKLAQALKFGWVVHLLFAPLLLAVGWSLIRFLAFSIGDDGEGPPGTGFFYAPCFLTVLLTIFSYYVTLAIVTLKSWFGRRASAR